MQACSRSLWLFLLLALSACGGGGSSGGSASNTAPTANFSFACTDLACNFTNLSTNQDAGDTIIAYMWTFGDGSATETSGLQVSGPLKTTISPGSGSPNQYGTLFTRTRSPVHPVHP